MGKDVRSQSYLTPAAASFSEESMEGYKYFSCWVWAINM